jgi:hypothetical protein
MGLAKGQCQFLGHGGHWEWRRPCRGGRTR